MKKTFIVKFLIAFLFVFFLTGQVVFAGENVWRIGTIYPLTGPNAKNGIKNFDGVKIATEMINEAGGVLGKKVVLALANNTSLTGDCDGISTQLPHCHQRKYIEQLSPSRPVLLLHLPYRPRSPN